ncbi:MAG: alanine racemase [Magnetovibrio sp.]|nr:alanine racemase [Magnetovibrio sp.]
MPAYNSELSQIPMSNYSIHKNLSGAELTIDLNAVEANYSILCSKAQKARVAAVVKADAYGTGMSQVARVLSLAGCKTFFVAHISEGVKLRNLLPDAEIHILNGLLIGTEEAYTVNNLIPVLGSIDEIDRWITFSNKATHLCDLHIDTGMLRLGLPPYEFKILLRDSARLSRLKLNLVISHLASADIQNSPQNIKQLEAFRTVRQLFPEGSSSLANSAGIFLGPEFFGDVVRPGIALYGCNPTPWLSNPMHSVINLKAKIIQCRNASPGETVSYGATYPITKPTTVATVSVGYADGYLRSLSNKGLTNINGIQIPIIGRVTMDTIMVDVSDLPESRRKPGDWVELIGDTISVDALADAAGTIPHEILTNLGNRYHREYLND